MTAALALALLLPAFDSPAFELTLHIIDVEADVAALRVDNETAATATARRLEPLRTALGKANPLRDRQQETLRRILARRVASTRADLADRAPTDPGRTALEARLAVFRAHATRHGASEDDLTPADLAVHRGVLLGRVRDLQARGRPVPDRLKARLARATEALDARRPLEGAARVKAANALIHAARRLSEEGTPSSAIIADTLLIEAVSP